MKISYQNQFFVRLLIYWLILISREIFKRYIYIYIYIYIYVHLWRCVSIINTKYKSSNKYVYLWYICVCTHIYIYIYIYIYTSTDRSVSFYQNSSVWLDRLDSRSWDRNPVYSNAIYIYIYIYIYSFICPWCNDYGRRKWTRQHEFKTWTWLIAFHIALIPLGKVWIQLFSLQLWVNSRTD